MHAAIHTNREDARAKLAAKIAHERACLADPRSFSTIDPHFIIADAEFRLRWIDCAPEGANHCLAPLQDKDGVPMGGNFNENVGPCRALRDARAARGLDPTSGVPRYQAPACAICGVVGNVCADSDGVRRCSSCSYAAWRRRMEDAV